jgi:hypothetical protein
VNRILALKNEIAKANYKKVKEMALSLVIKLKNLTQKYNLPFEEVMLNTEKWKTYYFRNVRTKFSKFPEVVQRHG